MSYLDNKIDKSIVFLGGVRCDEPGCDYREDNFPDSITTVRQLFEWNDSYLTKHCPKCGRILMTEKDSQSFKMVIAIMNSKIVRGINKIGKILGRKTSTFRVNWHGDEDGSFTVEDKSN
jgi:hypothetical protein